MCPSEQYETICREEFRQIHAKLDRLDESVRGNGRPGIHQRLDRLEVAAKTWRRLVWMFVGAALTFGIWTLRAWLTGG